VFEQIKDASRKPYIKAWQDLKNFTNSHNFEESPPWRRGIYCLLQTPEAGEESGDLITMDTTP
jgi:hypothetical protein